MAKIMNVDYEAIPAQAREMRTHGQELNKQLSEAYNTITNMHNSWYGQRYNSLVQEFNKIIPAINELLELVVGEFPFALETVANNYAQADKGSTVTSANKTAPNKISDLTLSSDKGMKFLTSEVTTAKDNILKNFTNAKEKMNSIESSYNKVQWQSEASEAFATKFKKLKSDIIAAFENINTQFSQLMQQTLDDIQNAETANTVK